MGFLTLINPSVLSNTRGGQSPLEVITPCQWTYRKRCRRREWQLSFCGAIWKQHPQVAPTETYQDIYMLHLCSVFFKIDFQWSLASSFVFLILIFLRPGCSSRVVFLAYPPKKTSPFQSAPNRLVWQQHAAFPTGCQARMTHLLVYSLSSSVEMRTGLTGRN